MSYAMAVSDFYEARRRAVMEQILARLRGQPVDLLAYDDVRQKLKARERVGVELKEIPLDGIVGSVGRYADFTRSFLPRHDSNEERWARVQVAVTNPEGVPPIEVYQMGEVYFVRDGHHRVSVAQQLGATQIQAYVTEVESRVPLSPEVRVEDLIIKAEYADFLERTNLDQIRPGADLSVTEAGQYQKIEEYIAVHRYFMGLDEKRDIGFAEAVAHWYDAVYWPVVQLMRERGVLHEFPNRTETDLYVWVLEQRVALEEELGWEVRPESAVQDLAQYSPRRQRLVARAGGWLREFAWPDRLEGGPPPGQWRAERVEPRQEDRLFADILVPVSGEEVGWHALTQAAEVARREGGQLRGLHVVPARAGKAQPAAQEVEQEFNRRCELAGVPGRLILEAGKVPRVIGDRSRWTDLVVLNVAHPPGRWVLARLSSGLRTLLVRSPRPVLAVPGVFSPMSRALLAYDGSRKADEALFVATYLAGRWQIPLVTVSVRENSSVTPEVQDRAREYLAANGVGASFVMEEGPPARAILGVAEAEQCDLILMGGYGRGPVAEVVIGSLVDSVLRASRWPVLICR